MSDGPILKDWQYFLFWSSVLALALMACGRIIWLLEDIRQYLIQLLAVLAKG